MSPLDNAIALLCASLLIVLVILNIKSTRKKCKSNFTTRTHADYKKELDLFKSLSIKDQIDYLNMNKEHKLALYRAVL